MHQPGEMREFTLSVPLREKWGEGMIAVPAGAEIEMDVRLESVHEGILVTADLATTAEGECSRCLREMTEGVEVEFQELFAYSGDEAADFEVQDDHVDLEIPVRDAIVLSLPFQPVCQPDCPGLDPITGERLAAQPDERASAPIDPRWAALQGLTDQATGTTGSESRNTEES
ncbi:YceD family protein [Microbacterium gorillae]|uniref:YceD family protein n=1 Tax=Microbacterium gorillae TaxID=1231063 RepID=UPI000694C37A|nr:YceD family protein [Microbacterium gorillae]